jgi:hypothetical protein
MKLEIKNLAPYLPYGLKLVNALNEEITMLGLFVKENKQEVLYFSKRQYETYDTDSGFYIRYYNCPIYSDIKNAKQFALEHNLHQGHFGDLLRGKAKSHKGWILA